MRRFYVPMDDEHTLQSELPSPRNGGPMRGYNMPITLES